MSALLSGLPVDKHTRYATIEISFYLNRALGYFQLILSNRHNLRAKTQVHNVFKTPPVNLRRNQLGRGQPMSPLRNSMPTPPRISPLQFLLLIQLEASPKYGYEMLKSIKEAFEGVWEPKTGTLYPALKSLERRELIEPLVRDGIDFYQITEKGRRFLEQVGSHQEISAKFSTRFITVLIKWISPELKKKIISSFSWMASEDTNFFGNMIDFFDESVDRNTRLLFLKGMRRKMSQRLEDLDKSISELEARS